jgi:hypothetical protein|tara:strand:- start:670 stop:1134 length:465 start_codon:yes stop_codon:yes gene_type:complete
MAKRKLSPSPQVKAKAETRRYEMLELYKGGATEREIAAILGVDRALVHREIKRVLNDLAEKYANIADEIRGLQMERYTTLLSRWWGGALQGDEAATRTVLQIMHRISEINGVIPDKPLISIDQRSVQLSQGEVTFSIEAASANYSADKDPVQQT